MHVVNGMNSRTHQIAFLNELVLHPPYRKLKVFLRVDPNLSGSFRRTSAFVPALALVQTYRPTEHALNWHSEAVLVMITLLSFDNFLKTTKKRSEVLDLKGIPP